MKKLILMLALVFAFAIQLKAQSNTTISYSIGLPMGDVSDFIGKTSFRGATISYEDYISSNVAIGVEVGWNVFYEEKAEDTYTFGNSALTGKQFRYSNHVPALFTVAYYLKPNETLNPFAGIGIGTIYTRRNTDMSLYTIEEEAWNFALSPEIGVQYELPSGKALTFALRYNNGFKAGNELEEAQSFLAINIGFSL